MELTLLAPLVDGRPWITAGVLALAIVLAAVARMSLRKRPSAADIEKKRRTEINAAGRIIAGELTDIVNTNLLVYNYDVHGVHYTSTQDTAELSSLLPEDPWQLLGPVSVKFDPRNPANSIIVCEQWSGISRKRTTQ